MRRDWRTKEAEKYRRLLTADPPICGLGAPVSVLNNCTRRAVGQDCLCRFDANEVADDAELIGCDFSLEIDLEAREVEESADELASCLQLAWAPATDDEREALARLTAVHRRLLTVARHGSSISDRYAEDVDP